MANFVYIQNNEIQEYHDLLPQSWQNVSGLNMLTDVSILNNLGWYAVTPVDVTYDPTAQYISGYTYSFDGTTVYQTPVLENIVVGPQPTADELLASQYAMIRNTRDQLLASSDWTELPSVQALHDSTWQTSWATYRQQLRNIPNLAESGQINIYEITWPTAPTT